MPDEAPRPPANNGALRLRLPGGWAAEVTGRELLLVVVLLVIGTALAWINYTGFTAILVGQQHLGVASEQRREEHEAIRKGNDALVCALSMEIPERRQAVLSGDVCRWLVTAGPRPR